MPNTDDTPINLELTLKFFYELANAKTLTMPCVTDKFSLTNQSLSVFIC
ncbi:hypothetical protein [Hydrocoleum sp. CS-953]|nr:hypothetical protein [Hydrocoleum sp. CS-953]